MDGLEALDLTPYANTLLGLEAGLADGSEFWTSVVAAGLQFYHYAGLDDLGGRVMPAAGNRLALVRAPDNAADANAVEMAARWARPAAPTSSRIKNFRAWRAWAL